MLLRLLISALLISLAACKGSTAPSPGEEPPSGTLVAGSGKEVTLLYPSDTSGKLVPVRTIVEERMDDQLNIESLVREYLSHDPGPTMVNPYPGGTALRAVYVLRGDTAVVDLGSMAAEGGGAETESYRVYGIVNTVCANFQKIKSVRILIDGQERETLLGHIDLQNSLPPEPSLNGNHP